LGQAFQLRVDLPDFLGAILQNEELLQLGLHARMLGVRAGGVNSGAVGGLHR
jgi:hypothetical protein